jgi:hypothetical protein
VAGYEGTFLVAVATAYFLALNGLAGYMFVQLTRTREELRELQADWRRLGQQVQQVANVSNLMMEAGVAALKNPGPPLGDAEDQR